MMGLVLECLGDFSSLCVEESFGSIDEILMNQVEIFTSTKEVQYIKKI